ncbi:hypothetical protein GFS76_13940 [Listeria monocytogenes]|nr:hypothetical protein [Listeria monocytogenes]EAG0495871.1 hypothetical protein [Listeria monocytogenes]EDJ9895057.1 hypothetical protein [Listeria monocytogenes]EDN8636297.1 hypothetical protein [Listeria monocytogenes]EDN9852863.1 hypothetical protein [Listeria monocytogenes]
MNTKKLFISSITVCIVLIVISFFLNEVLSVISNSMGVVGFLLTFFLLYKTDILGENAKILEKKLEDIQSKFKRSGHENHLIEVLLNTLENICEYSHMNAENEEIQYLLKKAIAEYKQAYNGLSILYKKDNKQNLLAYNKDFNTYLTQVDIEKVFVQLVYKSIESKAINSKLEVKYLTKKLSFTETELKYQNQIQEKVTNNNG